MARGEEFELVANMNKLGGSVAGRKTEQAVSPAIDPAAVRRGKKQEGTLYGINETEMKSLFDHRRTTPDICKVNYLADRFKLKREDVENLLRFTTVALTRPNPRVKGQLIAIRTFDANPRV
jgi:hypothetical protein